MRGLKSFPKIYFLKYNDKPVVIKAYDPKVKDVVIKYLKNIEPILDKYHLKPVLRGSSFFQIPGKGDIELGIHLNSNLWFQVIIEFINYFHGIENIDRDIAIFNEEFFGDDIEVVLMKGRTSKIDIALHKYLKLNKSLLIQYTELKYRFCTSKRTYQYQKDKFFRKIIKSIPENF
jgi:hypothetical protein